MTFTYVLTYFLVTLTCASVAIVLLSQLSNELGTEQEMRAFRGYIVWYLIFVLSNSAWVWINYGYLKIPGTPFSIINLIAICTASYYWFTYIELRLNPNLARTTAFRVISFLPLIVAIIFVVTTPLTGLVFTYTPNNEYVHGPLYSTMAVLAILYLIVATAHLFIYRSLERSLLMRNDYLAMMVFLVFPVIGGIIDVFVPNLPLMELTLLFGTILVYTNIQRSQIYNDVLTGLNNRRSSDEYLLDQIAQSSPNEPVHFIMGDIDNFKSINDEFGHVEGDRALRHLAEALRHATNDYRCHISRWGGDEFAVVLGTNAQVEPDEVIERIKEELARISAREHIPYPIHLSFGYSTCVDPHVPIDALVNEADTLMYQSKPYRRASKLQSLLTP